MKFARPHWSAIHQKKGFHFYTPFLAFCAFLYGMGVRARIAAYRYGLLKSMPLPGFVISIGNLVAGGTGKTPATITMAKWAHEQGCRVAVLSRGYGGRHNKKVLLVSRGERLLTNPTEAGDEPCLLAENLPGIPIIVCRKRYKAGLFAYNEFGSNFFILDDGFQHLELKRNINIILIDASNPFGNGHILPWGPLRDPLDQLKRADICILTRSHDIDKTQKTHEIIRQYLPKKVIFSAQHIPNKIVFPVSDETHRPEFLKNKRIVAFAGIACPESFRQTLTDLGGKVIHFKGFGDHHRFRAEEIENIIKIKTDLNAHFIITTEKDWVRIRPLMLSCPELGYIGIRFELLSGEHDVFFKTIKNHIRKTTALKD